MPSVFLICVCTAQVSLCADPPPKHERILVTTRFVEFTGNPTAQPLLRKLLPDRPKKDKLFQTPPGTDLSTIWNPFTFPEVRKPTSDAIIDSPERERFLDQFTASPNAPLPKRPRHGFRVSGFLTDPQFQVLIRGLKEKDGTDILSAPSAAVESGEFFTIKVGDGPIYGGRAERVGDREIQLELYIPPLPERKLYESGEERLPTAIVNLEHRTHAVLTYRRAHEKRHVAAFVKAEVVDTSQ